MGILDIIEKVKSGERLAQRQLFELLAPRLLSVSRQYCPSNLDPMDNLQDSFIKIFHNIASYDHTKGSIESWARKIVVNSALDKLNKKQIEIVLSNYDDGEFIDFDAINDEYDIEHLMKIIEALPDGYKQVFCLYEIDGYSHKEISELLHIKEASSRSQLNRSKQMLREMITKMNNFKTEFNTNIEITSAIK